MCACTEPVRTGIGAVCVEYGGPKCPITMLNHRTLVQNNVLFFYFGTLWSYDPLWRGFFFLGKPRKKRLASLVRLIITCCTTVLHIKHIRYQVFTKYIKIEPLFATSSRCHSEARNDQGRRVKLKLKKNLRWNCSVLSRITLRSFCLLWKGDIAEPKKWSNNWRPNKSKRTFLPMLTVWFEWQLEVRSHTQQIILFCPARLMTSRTPCTLTCAFARKPRKGSVHAGRSYECAGTALVHIGETKMHTQSTDKIRLACLFCGGQAAVSLRRAGAWTNLSPVL